MIASYKEKYDFEHIYTDNCSQDKTFKKLSDLANEHKNVKILRFSNNIGANRAIFMRLKTSVGDAVVLIKADLQNPPKMISTFIDG